MTDTLKGVMVNIVFIGERAFLREALNISGVDEDIAIENTDGNYKFPTFYQIDSVTGDILIFFEIPAGGFTDCIRAKMENDEEGIERVKLDYYQAKRTYEGVNLVHSNLDYDPQAPQPDDIILTEKYVDDKVSLEEEFRGHYRVFCMQHSIDKSYESIEEVIRGGREIQGLNIMTQEVAGGTKVVVRYNEEVFPLGYTLRAEIMRSIAIFSEEVRGILPEHLLMSENQGGFTVIVPFRISSLNIRQYLREL